MTTEIICADNLAWMQSQPGKVCDLSLFSPPYEAARTYGIGFNLRGQEYVDWLKARIIACLRITRGAVVCVVEGQTRDFSYSATPMLLAADLKRAGVTLRKPPIFRRVGIPGSGGPDWFRNDYEFCIVATNGGKLPWSDNTACGHPPKWALDAAMSNRLASGIRAGKSGRQAARDAGIKLRISTSGVDEFGTITTPTYLPPAKVNPGNAIDCIVGGGVMGSRLAHENEAPFPESLAEFFIRSLCPPGGTVLDICCGSGTTLAVAKRWGRNAIGIDVRPSQVELSQRRVAEVIDPLARLDAALASL